MIIFKSVAGISSFLESKGLENEIIGFVPTMGALHSGHISLIAESKKVNQITVCSIFVNPTQFNDKSDFEKYPTKVEDDIALLINAGCDALFLPTIEEVYPKDAQLEQYDLGGLETLWEGKYRPGHFQGVCQVLHRFISIIQPDNLYLGQKDYQQCMVIQRLIELSGFKCRLTICPTIREGSGLAMSSRNMRLNEQDKNASIAIYESLLFIKGNIAGLRIAEIETQVRERLTGSGFSNIDYVAICNAATLESITEHNPSIPVVALIAAFINGVRLIDNMLIS